MLDLHSARMWDQIQIRTSGPADGDPDVPAPRLIYLPGLHGDWTLVGSFKAALASRTFQASRTFRSAVRFVEITYPRTTSWTVTEYANGVLNALSEADVKSGWLLAESFGSQIAWEILKISAASEQAASDSDVPANRTIWTCLCPSGKSRFSPTGLILAGGFVRHPMRWIIPITQRINRAIPLRALSAICRFYSFYAKFRHYHAPETLVGVKEFVKNRAEEADRRAIAHRYTLILENDFSDIARSTTVPIYQLTGFFDPIVPWIFVHRWLKRNCASYAAWKLIWRADHNVLGSAPAAAAHQVLEWINSRRSGDNDEGLR